MTQDKGSLLIVDDDEDLRDLLVRYFAGQGFLVAQAGDGDEALAAIARGRPDVVILDTNLPGRSGVEILAVIRQQYAPAELPVLMATARGDNADVVAALRQGASDYLVKPFDLAVALARVQTQLSLKRSVDRILDLERSLARRNAELEAAVAELEKANRGMKRDLKAAAAVQHALLPQLPLGVDGANFAWHFRPCDELAGDLLGVIILDDRHVGLYVLDVVGHGVRAALTAVMASRVIAQLACPEGAGWTGRRRNPRPPLSPERLVEALNRAFPWDDQTEQLFTLLYGVLDLDTGRFDFVCAGHPSPVYLPRQGRARYVKATGVPIGLAEQGYAGNSLTLAPGDRLYLYSDGVPEARGPAKECFGRQRLLETLEQGHDLSLQDGVTALARCLEQWCGTTGPGDDTSILAVEFTGPAAARSGNGSARDDTALAGATYPVGTDAL
jgi:sigma-B regulation protein RsbU (phosphoserine phosphatase)